MKTYPDTTTVNYTYDNDSRLTQVSDPTGTYQFTFDNMGRLTGTTTSYAFLTGRNFTTGYGYDAASNRASFTDPESGSSPILVGGSITANHLDSCRPTSEQVDNYLSGGNVSVTAAAGVAVQQGMSPTNPTNATGNATGYGLGTPQVGVSGTYSVTLVTAINIVSILSNLVP